MTRVQNPAGQGKEFGMPRVQLIHWNAAEAEERAERLRAYGYQVACPVPQGPAFFRQLGQDPPTAVIIDLGRLPSQGRDAALTLRKQASTRRIPLVLVDGEPDKVARIRELLPDATYTTWQKIDPALAQALAQPPAELVVPRSVFEPYVGRPLAAKLGIKAGAVVDMVDAPSGFRETLGDLPEGVQVREGVGEPGHLIVWFTRSRADLQRGIGSIAARLGQGKLWIAWPKRASGAATDLSQQDVREAGLAAGLVDYKIVSIDSTWSGLLFVQKKG
jgi:CheY-like chemotaxis protein